MVTFDESRTSQQVGYDDGNQYGLETGPWTLGRVKGSGGDGKGHGFSR